MATIFIEEAVGKVCMYKRESASNRYIKRMRVLTAKKCLLYRAAMTWLIYVT